MRLTLVATTTFGLEAVVKREILQLGYEVKKVEDGKITYEGDERAIVRSNLWLRCAERVLLRMGEFQATEFEELFQNVKGMDWEYLIPPDGKFTVIGSSVKSTLHSVPACQSIVKKAIVERLSECYGIDRFEETGAEYTVKVSMLKDRATITVDTSGVALHKRGYRLNAVPAPIKETLAAAMINLSFWNKDRILLDPCCGSGTIPIEAAMIGKNIAPGLSRKFACEEWEFVERDLWKEERKRAFEEIKDVPLKIYAYDVDPRSMEAARKNAEEAGLDEDIIFKQINITDVKAPGENGIMITNPPYGIRIGEGKITAGIYEALKRFHEENPDWSLFMITADKAAEKATWGRPADRRRKLFNGNVETCYYQFHGERREY